MPAVDPAGIPRISCPMPDPHEPSASSSWIKIIHYAVVACLVFGGLAYWVAKRSTVNPMADPQAAEAMALVQTHRAQAAATLRQAITDRVKTLAARGQGVRLGEWTVEQEQESVYVVRVSIREQVTKGWFEREYIWKVDVSQRRVLPLTIAASDLMPVERDTSTPPLSMNLRESDVTHHDGLGMDTQIKPSSMRTG